MAYTYTKIGEVNRNDVVYEVYFKHQLTQNIGTLTTEVIVALSVKRKIAAVSSTLITDSVFSQSKIWDYTHRASVTVPSTTDYVDIIAKQKTLKHNADGTYTGGSVDIPYKWGSAASVINGSKTIAIPSFTVVEKVLSCGDVTVEDRNNSVNISAYAQGVYSAKLQHSYDNSTWQDSGVTWDVPDRSAKSLYLSPDLSIFHGQIYAPLYLRVVTLSGSETIGTSSVYTTRIFAGSKLVPSCTYTFVPYTNGQVSIDSVCGTGYAIAHVLPGLSSYQMKLTPTFVGGATLNHYTFVEYTQDGGAYLSKDQTSDTYNFIQTLNNDFLGSVTDSNYKTSRYVGPATITKEDYELPDVTITECYMDANGAIHISGTRSAKHSTFGALTNHGYLSGRIYDRTTQTWSSFFTEEEFTSNGTWTKTISGYSTSTVYNIKISCRDGLYQCRGTADDRYTVAIVNGIGLKPVIEFDNTRIDLNKPTYVTGAMNATGVVHSGSDVTATGSVTANQGRDVLGSDGLVLNAISALANNNSELYVGDDDYVTNYGLNNRFYGDVQIYKTTSDNVDRDLAQNGYCRLSNNLLLQWKRGQVTSDADGKWTMDMPRSPAAEHCLFGFANNSYQYNHGQYRITCDDVTTTTAYGRVINTTTGALAANVSVYVYVLWLGY